jgi:pimeloyl-ACP methyl ester carboxylesterase
MAPFADAEHATVDGIEVAYRRAGSGPPLVLLHGIPTSSRLWDLVAPDLVSDYDVIAPDMVGFGESEKPLDRDVSISAQAGYLAELLDVLGLDSVVLVGHDIGGGAAQVFAVEHGGRLDGLCLIDSVSFDSWPIAPMKALRAAAPVATQIPAGWVAQALGAALRREVENPAAYDSVSASLSAWDADAAALQAFFRNIDALDSSHTQAVAPLLGEITVPVHIVWGGGDHFQSPRYAARLSDAIPGSTIALLDSGHFAPWDKPERVAEEVRRLSRASAGPATDS